MENMHDYTRVQGTKLKSHILVSPQCSAVPHSSRPPVRGSVARTAGVGAPGPLGDHRLHDPHDDHSPLLGLQQGPGTLQAPRRLHPGQSGGEL